VLPLFLAVLTTPPMLGSVSAPLSALHFVTLCYSAFSGKKAIFDAKSAGAQRSGRTFAPCARSVSADPWNCNNATLKSKKDLHPLHVVLAQICKTALTLR
jgi:hypothetical protein